MSTISEDLVKEKIENMSEVTESVNKSKPNIDTTPKPAQKKKPKKSPSHMAGVTATALTFGLGRLIGGEEASPRKDLCEEQSMVEAYTTFFEHYEITEIPPSVGLLIVVGAYGIRVSTLAPSKSKLQRIKEWIGIKLGFVKKIKKLSNAS